MIEYTIEATVGKGKIDYKHFIKFQLEIPEVIDANKLVYENSELTDKINLKSLEQKIEKTLQKFIDIDIKKTITFDIIKKENEYDLKLRGLK